MSIMSLQRRSLQFITTAANRTIAVLLTCCLLSPFIHAQQQSTAAAIDIGARRELFIDSFLIDRFVGKAEQRLHKPIPREITIVHDAPWEGSGSGYHSVFQDGDIYRMYYKAWHLEVSPGKLNSSIHPLFCCYAESKDGIHWTKPNLGIHEFNGSKNNNIASISEKNGELQIDAGHPAVFIDNNPATPQEARYKAIVRSKDHNGLIPLKSADGVNFKPITKQPILSGVGAFDSQNLAFWDETIGKYRAYWRYFTKGTTNKEKWKPAGIRAIRTATSNDLVHWDDITDLTYTDSPPEQLYTNQIKPYARAPHILIGFPTRYTERGESPQMTALPENKHRKMRSSVSPRYGTAITDALLMCSRDGHEFKRWNEAFFRPGIERPNSWNYGHQYVAWHVVQTANTLPGAPNELSFYASESYWTGKGSAVRRYTLRLDGFVSLSAPMQGGEVITKPFKFTGNQLELNYSTSVAGSIRVELQDAQGIPIKEFKLEDCPEHFGDTVGRTVQWKDNPNLAQLAGKTIRIRFVLKDADLYSLKFQTTN